MVNTHSGEKLGILTPSSRNAVACVLAGVGGYLLYLVDDNID
ncbi:MAG: hypothetical protein JWO49_567 [Arthrobacter sp.]|nr:hypothetical protein [Arthrobacter sp.]MCU1547590.1 hypothetical protein [Arthrobacter sp.]